MKDKIKVLIVDDEAPARELLKGYLSYFENYHLTGECENGFEALKAVKELNPDLILLDVQMPRINGLELLEVLSPCPEIIFTTAYDQYAIKAFEMNAVDYLLKPFTRDRFGQALEKVEERLQSTADKDDNKPVARLREQLVETIENVERIITRMGTKLTVIPVDSIHFIEAQDDYVMIYSEQGNHLKEQRMKYYEEHLPEDRFIRVHRSYIANITQISAVEKYGKESYIAIMKSGEKIKVSLSGYKKLKKML